MMRFRNHRLRHHGGFTLIELLIAGAISAMLLGALFAMLFGTLRLREAAFRTAETGSPRDQVAAVLRRDLTGAAAPSGLLAGTFYGQSSGSLRADQAALTFYTTSGALGENLPWGEIQLIEYELTAPLDEAQQGQDLLRRATRNLLTTTLVEESNPDDAAAATDESDGISELRLLSGVESLTLEFWDGEAWQEEWDSTANENANPVAVQLRLDFIADEAGLRESPLELVCELSAQPRPSAAATAEAAPASSTPAASNSPEPANAPEPATAPAPPRGGDGGGGGA